ncbi:MAG: hypothetical protein KFW21_03490 [Spirochaetota bacterium]|nr:hypothetical protein [Spirochaetota bacterium]
MNLWNKKKDNDFDLFFTKVKINYESISEYFHRFTTVLDTIALKFEKTLTILKKIRISV